MTLKSSTIEESIFEMDDQVKPDAFDKKSISKMYSYWQLRILYSVVFGYAAYYLVRQNLSPALPVMAAELGYTRTQLGVIASVAYVLYGIGKFVNGYISDRSNARYFMCIGLVGALLTCFMMGWGTSLHYFVIIWAISSVFQSMGWPPVSRLLTHWFSPTELGTKWGIANSSHQIGAAIASVLSAYLIDHYGWQSAFFVPAVISLGVAVLLFNRLRDIPESLGLPSIETYKGLKKAEKEVAAEDNSSLLELIQTIIYNRNLWLVCLGNMFLYIVRMGVVTWAPTFLREFKGATLTSSGWQLAAFEVAGMVGGIAAGWLSDKIFAGRRGPVSFLYMVGIIFALCYFWFVPAGHNLLNTLAMIGVGFLVYGPQVLVGVAAADFASKKAVGMAVGLTGTFGYIGASISGAGIGWTADNYGWDGGFVFFIVAAILACLCFALTWNNRAKVLENNPD